MVFPSVEAFIKRAKWLIAAAQGNFADEHKAKNPNQLQKAIQKVSCMSFFARSNVFLAKTKSQN